MATLADFHVWLSEEDKPSDTVGFLTHAITLESLYARTGEGMTRREWVMSEPTLDVLGFPVDMLAAHAEYVLDGIDDPESWS